MSLFKPYTHDDHAARCAVAAYKGQSLALRDTFVQARIGRTVCCARIVSAWDTSDGVEMWQLDLRGPIHGRMSTPSHNVRACSGVDGLCSCTPFDPIAPEVARALGRTRSAAMARAALPEGPDGNHGETPRESEA